jgi:hypothetical protein
MQQENLYAARGVRIVSPDQARLRDRTETLRLQGSSHPDRIPGQSNRRIDGENVWLSTPSANLRESFLYDRDHHCPYQLDRRDCQWQNEVSAPQDDR